MQIFFSVVSVVSVANNIQSRIPPRCDNCRFSAWIVGVGRPVLVCKEKRGYVGWYRSVYLDSSCVNFYPSETFKKGAKAVRRIPLTRGKFALVDARDYYQLDKYKWFASFDNNTFYAARTQSGKTIKMHRLIMNAPEHLVVDHIDHDGLNNRRSNLRLCTIAQNIYNQPPQKGGYSQYKGVSWHKNKKKWYASIRVNKKPQYIGMFENEIDAAKAYDKKAAEVFGEFACFNFPPKATEKQPQRPPRNMSFPRRRETRIKSDTIRRGFFNHEGHEGSFRQAPKA